MSVSILYRPKSKIDSKLIPPDLHKNRLMTDAQLVEWFLRLNEYWWQDSANSLCGLRDHMSKVLMHELKLGLRTDLDPCVAMVVAVQRQGMAGMLANEAYVIAKFASELLLHFDLVGNTETK